jgi:phosphotransferase system  glucose/maltose/N-acetylglucosamine-specific IIC component
VALGVVALVYLYKLRLFINLLKTDEDRIWESLGKPSPSLQMMPNVSLAIVSYILKEKYRNIQNPNLVKLGSSTRRYLIIGFVLFPLIVIIPMLGLE